MCSPSRAASGEAGPAHALTPSPASRTGTVKAVAELARLWGFAPAAHAGQHVGCSSRGLR